jgi:hypothetical protein
MLVRQDFKMNIHEKINKKFESLLSEGKQVFQRYGWTGDGWRKFPPHNEYLRFRTESLNLIKKVCGEDSEHYQQLRRIAEDKTTANNSFYFNLCYGVVEAAYRDFTDDFLFDMRAMLQADLLGDFIEQAEILLKEGYFVPAASLTGAVLEDTLRKMCDQRPNISYPEKTNINMLNDLLAKDGVYNKLTQKEITAKADIRNNADHGNFDQFNGSDVKDMIVWVKRFASDHLK